MDSMEDTMREELYCVNIHLSQILEKANADNTQMDNATVSINIHL